MSFAAELDEIQFGWNLLTIAIIFMITVFRWILNSKNILDLEAFNFKV